ncbi:MAG: creatininase family protein [Vicinamibacteria bacterium]|nr:creatininase family protein [Vicinamibacteria bacterium]
MFHPTALALTLALQAAATSPPPTRVLHLGDLNTDQIRKLDLKETAIVVPIAILEEHGPFLPSYSDGYPAERLSNEIAKAVGARAGWTAVLFPTIPLGVEAANAIGRKASYPGSYTVRMSTLRAVMMDLADELGEQGFRWIFLVTLHAGPNHHLALDQASDYFRGQYGGRMVNLYGLQPVFEAESAPPFSEAQSREDGFSVHAGIRETSEVLFHRPDLVAQQYRNAKPLTGQSMADLEQIAQKPDWPGYFGSPRLSSADFGKKIWEERKRVVIKTVLEILDGADYGKTPRYSAFSSEDEATAEVNRAAAARDEERARRQMRWLESKGIR